MWLTFLFWFNFDSLSHRNQYLNTTIKIYIWQLLATGFYANQGKLLKDATQGTSLANQNLWLTIIKISFYRNIQIA